MKKSPLLFFSFLFKEGGDGYFMGKLTFDRSNEVLSKVFKMTDGKLPLIGGGGVMNGNTNVLLIILC